MTGTAKQHHSGQAATATVGRVTGVRSSVVDVWFPQDLPELNTRLEVTGEATIIIEVISQVDAHRVRGIALTPHSGFSQGGRSYQHRATAAGTRGRTVVGASI